MKIAVLVVDGRLCAHFGHSARFALFDVHLALKEILRREDIPALASHFLRRYAQESGKTITGIAPETMRLLEAYGWPGNVRELENVIERALILSTGSTLYVENPARGATRARHAAPSSPAAASWRLDNVERDHIRQVLERCGWRVNGEGNAAEALGLHPNTLRFRMKKLGISRPRLT